MSEKIFKPGAKTATFVLVILAVVAMVGVLIGVAYLLSSQVEPLVGLPVLAISSIILLLGTLSVVSIAFAIFGLNDKTQALGLPEGSIRAVIALSLVVLFGVLTIYLYGDMASGQVGTVFTLNAPQATALRTNAPAGEIVTDVEQADKTHRVFVRNSTDRASEDFAKQILTLLGTLVTAIASFYFGAQTVVSATSGSTSGPVPSPNAVTPSSGAPGASLTLTVSGSNLGSIDGAKLKMGNTVIASTKVLSNQNTVTADFSIPQNAANGSWTVIVSVRGSDYTVPGTFSIL